MRSSPKITCTLTGEYMSPVDYLLGRGRGDVDIDLLAPWQGQYGEGWQPNGRLLGSVVHLDRLRDIFKQLEENLIWIGSQTDGASEQEAEKAWSCFAEQIGFNGSFGELVGGFLEAHSAVC